MPTEPEVTLLWIVLLTGLMLSHAGMTMPANHSQHEAEWFRWIGLVLILVTIFVTVVLQ